MNKIALRILPAFIAIAFLAGCGNNTPQHQPEAGNGSLTPQGGIARNGSAPAKPVYERSELEELLASSEARFKSIHQTDPLERLAGYQYATAEELMMIARALDTDGSYREEIDTYQNRFLPDSIQNAILARRLTGSSLGIYSTAALLYAMRFQYTPEKLDVLKSTGKKIEDMLSKDEPIIQPMSLMAESTYRYIRLILEDIDKNNTLQNSFIRSDSLFQAGRAAAQSGEDRFLNALYRTFEIGQVWAIQLNPTQSDKLGTLKAAFHNNILASKTVGDQMATSAEYIYRMFPLVAILTLDVIFPPTAEK